MMEIQNTNISIATTLTEQANPTHKPIPFKGIGFLTVKTLRMQAFGVWISRKLKQIFIMFSVPSRNTLQDDSQYALTHHHFYSPMKV
jgi:hypothetical protein